jgi:hypothetical protein
MAGWSTVVGYALAFIAGGGVVQAWHWRAAAEAVSGQLDVAETRPERLVQQDRRIERDAARSAESTRAGEAVISANADALGCVVPDVLAGLLAERAEATRARADGRKVPGAEVP